MAYTHIHKYYIDRYVDICKCYIYLSIYLSIYQMALVVKYPPVTEETQETWVGSLSQEDPLE